MAGIVTGENVLVERYPFGESEKVWPVNADDVKEHIQDPSDFDDNLILGIHGFLASATEEVEKRASVALITQSRIQYISESDIPYLEGATVELSVRPTIDVTAIKYLDSNDAVQTLPDTYYRVSERTNSVYFKRALPTVADGPNSVWIEYEAGYGTTQSVVPPLAAELVKIIAARRYDYRSGDGTNQADAWERMIRGLIRTFGDSGHRY